jgi:hypothetical protein
MRRLHEGEDQRRPLRKVAPRRPRIDEEEDDRLCGHTIAGMKIRGRDGRGGGRRQRRPAAHDHRVSIIIRPTGNATTVPTVSAGGAA